jgi:hypothetical protein
VLEIDELNEAAGKIEPCRLRLEYDGPDQGVRLSALERQPQDGRTAAVAQDRAKGLGKIGEALSATDLPSAEEAPGLTSRVMAWPVFRVSTPAIYGAPPWSGLANRLLMLLTIAGAFWREGRGAEFPFSSQPVVAWSCKACRRGD